MTHPPSCPCPLCRVTELFEFYDGLAVEERREYHRAATRRWKEKQMAQKARDEKRKARQN
jgi:hypothetical protein